MKKNKNNKGLTLLETLISTVMFGIIMVLIFQMSSAFFRLFTTTTTKQEMNSTFIKAYNQIQKDFMITDSYYIYSYKTELKNIKTRWIALPVPVDENNIVRNERNSFNWQRIYIYYLNCINNSCPECPSKNNSVGSISALKNENYKYCSDKELIRLVYNNNGARDLYNFSKNMSSVFCDNISNYTLPYKVNNSLFPNDDSLFQFVEKRLITKDLFDMDITEKNGNITVKMSSVRKNDIKKTLNYGTTDFTKEPGSNYVDQIEFIVTSKNG